MQWFLEKTNYVIARGTWEVRTEWLNNTFCETYSSHSNVYKLNYSKSINAIVF